MDALGRTSQLGSSLETLGAPPLIERRSECGLLYYSRHFRLREGVEMPRTPFLLGGPRGEIGYLAFAVFVEDNRTFATILSIPPWDRELRALKSEDAYMAAALSLPALVPWVHPDQSAPITPVLPMGSLQNLHRSLVVEGEPVAVGIQPIGDALCHTNPTFAYGASLSIYHGFALARIASGSEDAAQEHSPSTMRSGATRLPASTLSPPRTEIDSGSARRADRRARTRRQHGPVPAHDRLSGGS